MASQSCKNRLAIGIDIGGTKIAAGLVDSSGRLLSHCEEKTPVEQGPERIEQVILKLVNHLAKDAPFPPMAVGIGVAGQIDTQSEVIVFAPNLYWHNVPLSVHLQSTLHIPVHCLNDVRAASIAEWLFGSGKGCDDFICAFIGTGIGAGIVSGGKLLTGANNSFGEIGHMSIDSKGPLCTCGRKGCFEALGGGRAISLRAKAKIGENLLQVKDSPLFQMVQGNIEEITAKEVIAAYRLNDKIAVDIIEEVKESLILGFSNLINICNPRLLILGGGLIQGMPELISIIKEGVFKNALKSATQSFDVVKAQFEKYAGVIGSATAAINFMKGRKL